MGASGVGLCRDGRGGSGRDNVKRQITYSCAEVSGPSGVPIPEAGAGLRRSDSEKAMVVISIRVTLREHAVATSTFTAHSRVSSGAQRNNTINFRRLSSV